MRLKTAAAAAGALALVAAGAFWALSAPTRLDPSATAGLVGDAGRGRTVFLAGGCASCHAPPGAKGPARLTLSGGRRFVTPFGTFAAPNISPHPEAGIGAWDLPRFADAVLNGVSPEGAHYYPAFPYASYVRMTLGDVADLHAFLRTLPASDAPSPPHDLPLPFRLRRGIGLWKLVGVTRDWVIDVPEDDPRLTRGRYLVEGPGHCGECHTPRNAIGTLILDRWLKGAPLPDGPGMAPDLTPGGKEIGGWSEADIAYYLESGFTPEYDSVGGSMVEVIENLSGLTPYDRAAIAAYLKALPAR